MAEAGTGREGPVFCDGQHHRCGGIIRRKPTTEKMISTSQENAENGSSNSTQVNTGSSRKTAVPIDCEPLAMIPFLVLGGAEILKAADVAASHKTPTMTPAEVGSKSADNSKPVPKPAHRTAKEAKELDPSRKLLFPAENNCPGTKPDFSNEFATVKGKNAVKQEQFNFDGQNTSVSQVSADGEQSSTTPKRLVMEIVAQLESKNAPQNVSTRGINLEHERVGIPKNYSVDDLPPKSSVKASPGVPRRSSAGNTTCHLLDAPLWKSSALIKNTTKSNQMLVTSRRDPSVPAAKSSSLFANILESEKMLVTTRTESPVPAAKSASLFTDIFESDKMLVTFRSQPPAATSKFPTLLADISESDEKLVTTRAEPLFLGSGHQEDPDEGDWKDPNYPLGKYHDALLTGKMSVKNETELSLHISLWHVLPIYYRNNVQPGEWCHFITGKVWFTIKARVADGTNEYTLMDNVRRISGTIVLGAATAGINALFVMTMPQRTTQLFMHTVNTAQASHIVSTSSSSGVVRGVVDWVRGDREVPSDQMDKDEYTALTGKTPLKAASDLRDLDHVRRLRLRDDRTVNDDSTLSATAHYLTPHLAVLKVRDQRYGWLDDMDMEELIRLFKVYTTRSCFKDTFQKSSGHRLFRITGGPARCHKRKDTFFINADCYAHESLLQNMWKFYLYDVELDIKYGRTSYSGLGLFGKDS